MMPVTLQQIPQDFEIILVCSHRTFKRSLSKHFYITVDRGFQPMDLKISDRCLDVIKNSVPNRAGREINLHNVNVG